MSVLVRRTHECVSGHVCCVREGVMPGRSARKGWTDEETEDSVSMIYTRMLNGTP